MQPIRNFFQRVVPPNNQNLVIRRNRHQELPHLNPNNQHNIDEINHNNNRLAAINPRNRNFITRAITTFFQPIQHPNHDPFIPIPHTDYRPP
jgi:hypothetical protein